MRHRTLQQRGAFIVEFTLCLLLFFALVLAMLEFSRMLFIWSTVQEVTRRAARSAAVSDFSNPATVDGLRAAALMGATVPLAPFLTAQQLRIEYLSQAANGALSPVAALPACPVANAVNCARDPHGGDCIRYVRARFCSSQTGACDPVPYEPMSPLLPLNAVVPPSTTVLRAQSLGRRPGASAACP